MKTSFSQMKKQVQQGFTLVEIAIVLMIIGLLIGGVLRGQELITSARVRNVIDQKAGTCQYRPRDEQYVLDWCPACTDQGNAGICGEQD